VKPANFAYGEKKIKESQKEKEIEKKRETWIAEESLPEPTRVSCGVICVNSASKCDVSVS
jgi:hypothetical protein